MNTSAIIEALSVHLLSRFGGKCANTSGKRVFLFRRPGKTRKNMGKRVFLFSRRVNTVQQTHRENACDGKRALARLELHCRR